jgi:hypothetical protein
VEAMLIFDNWWDHEPNPECYEFDNLFRYEEILKQHGLKMLVLTPIGTPLWTDPSWYLENTWGERNDFSEIVGRIPPRGTMPPHEDGLKLGMQIFSYWHTEAQQYTQKYICKIRDSLKYATL